MNPIGLSVKHEWNEDRQSRLDILSAKELTGALNASERRELAQLVADVEAEEQARLSPALERIRQEQTALRRKVHQTQASNEKLAALVAQQEQMLADTRRTLNDLQRRHQVIREVYFRVTGELLAPAV